MILHIVRRTPRSADAAVRPSDSAACATPASSISSDNKKRREKLVKSDSFPGQSFFSSRWLVLLNNTAAS